MMLKTKYFIMSPRWKEKKKKGDDWLLFVTQCRQKLMWRAIGKQEMITGGYSGTTKNKKFQKKGNISRFDTLFFFGVPGFPLRIIIYDK